MSSRLSVSPKQAVPRMDSESELGAVRFTHEDGTGGFEALDSGGAPLQNEVTEDQATGCRSTPERR